MFDKLLDKLFWAQTRRRAKRIAVALMIDNKYQCNETDVKAIIGACWVGGWSDKRIKELILEVNKKEEAE